MTTGRAAAPTAPRKQSSGCRRPSSTASPRLSPNGAGPASRSPSRPPTPARSRAYPYAREHATSSSPIGPAVPLPAAQGEHPAAHCCAVIRRIQHRQDAAHGGGGRRDARTTTLIGGDKGRERGLVVARATKKDCVSPSLQSRSSPIFDDRDKIRWKFVLRYVVFSGVVFGRWLTESGSAPLREKRGAGKGRSSAVSRERLP